MIISPTTRLPPLPLWRALLLLLLLAAAVDGRLSESSRRNRREARPPEFGESLDGGQVEPMLLDSTILSGGGAGSGPGPVQCEPISVGLCAQMAYQSTRMPNFFHDANQIEAMDRALQYQELVESRCSAHVHAYICELLTPVCLEDSREAMKRFEIYPCRSFCRRVKRDCEQEIVRLNERLFSQGSSSHLPGFFCDQLPFESNGGNGTLHGPCHETPESLSSAGHQQPPQVQQPGGNSVKSSTSGSYRPSSQQQPPVLDQSTVNIPPSSDTSSQLLDTNILKPAIMGPDIVGDSRQFPPVDKHGPSDVVPQSPDRSRQQQQQHQQQQQQQQDQLSGLTAQLYLHSQSFIQLVTRYSNSLSIMTVLLFLLVFNSKHLRSLKSRLCRSPHLSTKSSSTSGSQHPLHPSKLCSYPAIGSGTGAHHHHSLSPSSSSRSLMLIAASNGKQPPSHQLVATGGGGGETGGDSDEAPQKALLHALNQRTFMSVNGGSGGTLDRVVHRQQQQQQHNRYLLATAQHGGGDKQQLFNTLDSQSSQSNQYDYIQVSAHNMSDHNVLRQQQQQQQPQLYSNILLSSPSHQVLLFGNGHHQVAETTGSRQFGAGVSPRVMPPPLPASRHAPYLTTSLSPYAAPNGSPYSPFAAGGCDLNQQRSFQRRGAGRRTSSSSGGQQSVALSAAASSSSRTKRASNGFGPPPGQPPSWGPPSHTSPASSASSAASSSSSGAVSPPNSSGAAAVAPLLGSSASSSHRPSARGRGASCL